MSVNSVHFLVLLCLNHGGEKRDDEPEGQRSCGGEGEKVGGEMRERGLGSLKESEAEGWVGVRREQEGVGRRGWQL